GSAPGSARRTAGTTLAARPRTPRSSAARTRSRGRRQPSRRVSCAALPGASFGPCPQRDCTARPIVRVLPMAIAREAEPVGSLQEVREAGLDREDLLTIYRNMLVTRGIEERGHILYKQGKIPGSFYTGRGNEAAAVGVATAMSDDDVGTPLPPDMGVHITRSA